MARRKQRRSGLRFVASFKHWRNGVTYFASDYGHKGWPIG